MHQTQDPQLLRGDFCTPLEMLPGHERPKCDLCHAPATQLVRGLSGEYPGRRLARQLLCEICTESILSSDGAYQ